MLNKLHSHHVFIAEMVQLVFTDHKNLLKNISKTNLVEKI